MSEQCHHTPTVSSVHQTLDEMDFERGIWYAAMTGDEERVRSLLKKGNCVDAEDKSGYTALHYAARCGYTNICALLLEAGANINAATRAGQSTPLHRAALAGRKDTVKLLLRYRADPLAKDTDGRNVVHRAVEGGDPATLLLLLQSVPGELYNSPDKVGKTPVDYARGCAKLEGIFDSVRNK